VPVEDGNIALITLGAASVAAVAPIASLLVTWLIRSREKTVQWAREDLVAAKAAAANRAERERQEAVARQAAEAAKLLLEAQEKTSQQNTETQGKLNQIHTLVNSNLTREMQERLVALKGQIYLTKEVIRLNKQNKIEPNGETETALRNLEAVASNLETSLAERSNSTTRADSEQT
jgi:uncharacterized membrane protein YhiD involved in acid resistance